MGLFLLLLLLVISALNADSLQGKQLIEKLQNIKDDFRKVQNNLAAALNDTVYLEKELRRWEHKCSCAPCLPREGTNYCDCRNLEAKKDCLAFREAGIKVNGLYKILGPKFTCHHAYCDQTTDGGGWTVIQRRKDGSENFYRKWGDYKNGFGNLEREFWLGNDKIHYLTANLTTKSKLLINMVIHGQSKQVWAKYGSFSIGDESTKYTLHVGGFSGNTTDYLSHHNNMKFTTKDQDNDQRSGNCAINFKGAWWYKSCYYSNLNGLYAFTSKCENINWNNSCNVHPSFVEMKVRRNI